MTSPGNDKNGGQESRGEGGDRGREVENNATKRHFTFPKKTRLRKRGGGGKKKIKKFSRKETEGTAL